MVTFYLQVNHPRMVIRVTCVIFCVIVYPALTMYVQSFTICSRAEQLSPSSAQIRTGFSSSKIKDVRHQSISSFSVQEVDPAT